MSESFVAQVVIPKSKVNCHAPKVIHNNVKIKQQMSTTTADDVIQAPKKVIVSERKRTPSTDARRKAKYVQSRYMMSSTSKDTSISTSKLTTPKNVQGAKTSTPAVALTQPHFLNLDVSDITNCSYTQMGINKNRLAVTKKRSTDKPTMEGNCPKIKKILKVPKPDFKEVKNSSGDDNAMHLYNDYLVWKFLNLKLELSRKQQNAKAMSDMETLSNMVIEKQAEEKQLEEEIMKLEHLQKLKTAEDLNDHLGNISENLPKTKENFVQLTESLDSTCHKLPLDGIANVDIDKFDGILKETKQLLGEVGILMQSKTETVNKMSETTTNLENTLAKATNLYSSLDNSMAESSTNLLKLQSLSIQESL